MASILLNVSGKVICTFIQVAVLTPQFGEHSLGASHSSQWLELLNGCVYGNIKLPF